MRAGDLFKQCVCPMIGIGESGCGSGRQPRQSTFVSRATEATEVCRLRLAPTTLWSTRRTASCRTQSAAARGAHHKALPYRAHKQPAPRQVPDGHALGNIGTRGMASVLQVWHLEPSAMEGKADGRDPIAPLRTLPVAWGRAAHPRLQGTAEPDYRPIRSLIVAAIAAACVAATWLAA